MRRIIVETTLVSGPAQVFGGSDAAAFAAGAQPDKIYVHATVGRTFSIGKLELHPQ